MAGLCVSPGSPGSSLTFLCMIPSGDAQTGRKRGRHLHGMLSLNCAERLVNPRGLVHFTLVWDIFLEAGEKYSLMTLHIQFGSKVQNSSVCAGFREQVQGFPVADEFERHYCVQPGITRLPLKGSLGTSCLCVWYENIIFRRLKKLT